MKNKTPQLEDGYIKIANELIDVMCSFRIPGGVRQIVDCVIKKTYGWNKKEDWIAHSQIVKITGMKKGNVSRELSKAITHKLVIQSDNKLRLNKNYKEWISFKTLSKVITGKNNRLLSKVITPVIQSDTKVITLQGNKIHYTKDTYTKDTIMQDEKHLAKINPINEVITLFKVNNPTYERLYSNKTQRGSIERLLKRFGMEKVQRMISVAVAYYGKPYAPQITTPYQLEQNLGKLIAFWKQEQNKDQKLKVTEIHI